MTQPARIPELLRLAFRTAMSGRRGPVFVEIPRDVLNDQVVQMETLAPEAYRSTHPTPPHPDAVRDGRAPPAHGPSVRSSSPAAASTWAGASDLVVRLSDRVRAARW